MSDRLPRVSGSHQGSTQKLPLCKAGHTARLLLETVTDKMFIKWNNSSKNPNGIETLWTPATPPIKRHLTWITNIHNGMVYPRLGKFCPSSVHLAGSPVQPLGLLLVLLRVVARHGRPAGPVAPAPPAVPAAVPPPGAALNRKQFGLCFGLHKELDIPV